MGRFTESFHALSRVACPSRSLVPESVTGGQWRARAACTFGDRQGGPVLSHDVLQHMQLVDVRQYTIVMQVRNRRASWGVACYVFARSALSLSAGNFHQRSLMICERDIVTISGRDPNVRRQTPSFGQGMYSWHNRFCMNL